MGSAQAAVSMLLLLVLGSFGVCALTWMAYRFPAFTLFAVVFLGQVMGQEMQLVLPEAWREPAVGPVQIRYLDPLLIGIVCASVVRVVLGGGTPLIRVLRRFWAAGLFLAWMVGRTVVSIPQTGAVAALGEFRTYYGVVLLGVYVVLSFPTERDQWRGFRALLAAIVFLIPVALFRGGVLHGFAVGPRTRWLSSFSNLALVFGVCGLWLAAKRKCIRVPGWAEALFALMVLALTVSNGHRSVWLSTVVGVLSLLLFARVLDRRTLRVWLPVAVVCVVGLVMLSRRVDLASYFTERATAFTDYSRDANSYWRSALWAQSMRRIRQHPLAGLGLGTNFHLIAPNGKVVTTSPHNMYLTVAYHGGVVALVLMAAMMLQGMFVLLVSRRRAVSARSGVILTLGLVSLLMTTAYMVAYTFDLLSWLLAGLAACAAVYPRGPAAVRPVRRGPVYAPHRPPVRYAPPGGRAAAAAPALLVPGAGEGGEDEPSAAEPEP